MNEFLTMDEILRQAQDAAESFHSLSEETQNSLRSETDWTGAQLSGYECTEPHQRLEY